MIALLLPWAAFGADAAFPPCPPGVRCTASFPYVESDTTVGGSRGFDAYRCSPADEAGPERIYRLDLDEDAFVAVSLGNLGTDVDVDVHLLRSLDDPDCLDRGDWTAGSLVPAGSWYVVVDSYRTASGREKAGPYTVSIAATSARDLAGHGMSPEVAERALRVFDAAWRDDQTERFEYGVIDFAEPSTTERFWVVDLASGSLLYRLLVAHGSGTAPGGDPRFTTEFSNTPGTHASSLGLVRTATTYQGQWRTSLRLDGLDGPFNSNVRERAIVLHGAEWAGQDFVDEYGYLGRSWGCPTVDDDVADEVIERLKGGVLLWTYYPDPTFLQESAWLD